MFTLLLGWCEGNRNGNMRKYILTLATNTQTAQTNKTSTSEKKSAGQPASLGLNSREVGQIYNKTLENYGESKDARPSAELFWMWLGVRATRSRLARISACM